jgi:hypothetical protein
MTPSILSHPHRTECGPRNFFLTARYPSQPR